MATTNHYAHAILGSARNSTLPDTISFSGLRPSHKNLKIRHFERRICIRLQAKTHLTWWTPQTENRSIY